MTETRRPQAATRALIADDERLMRDQLRARLAEVWPGLQIVAEARNGLEAVELYPQIPNRCLGLRVVDLQQPHQLP